jgi:hypothetical protein
MWINRNGRDEVTIPPIGRGVLIPIVAPLLFRTASTKRDADGIMNVLASSKGPRSSLSALGVQRLLNVNDVIRLLRSEVKRAGSQRAFAREAGVNVSVVSKTLRGTVLPSEKILAALKLRVVYLSK